MNPKHPDTHTLQIPLSEPEGFHLSIFEVYTNCVNASPFSPYFPSVLDILSLGKEITNTLELHPQITQILNQIPPQEFDTFIHLLHITMFVEDNLGDTAVHYDSITPVTDAVKELIQTFGCQKALTILPRTIIDVLTAHPVDMDRGLVGALKQEFAGLAQQWQQKKAWYPLIQDHDLKLSFRHTLNSTYQSLQNTIMQLLQTPNYRTLQVKPESEQRRLSRAVKTYERSIISHWQNLVGIVRQVFLIEISKSCELPQPLVSEGPLRSPLSKKVLTQLIQTPSIQQHPLFDSIMNLDNTLCYALETWRGDMDGNPKVNGTTIALSTAYGRKRCFERLSADEAVIRYTVPNNAFSELENALDSTLDELIKTGTPAWKRYIQDRREAQWTPIQIYSGLTYYRMVEMTEAAEQFSRNPDNLTLLSEGFETTEAFLAFSKPLEKAESLAHITGGTWHTLRRLVQLRGLSLGDPHVRNTESVNAQIIDEYCQVAFPKPYKNKPFLSLSDTEKHMVLTEFKKWDHPPIETILNRLPSAHLSERLSDYLTMVQIDSTFTLIQSDSGTVMPSIHLSILLLSALSHILGHKGKWVALCENKASMESALQLMETAKTPEIFQNVIMMCAGSDNQKKLGPFYSAYLNHVFLETAAKKNISAFFGAGDSPLRSSLHHPFCQMRTFQPGSRKKYFFSDKLFRYLSERLSTQISAASNWQQPDTSVSKTHRDIFKLIGESMYNAYQEEIEHRTALHNAIKSISEIVTTYFSRPTKKIGTQGFILNQIRAIDSGRAQLILNTFDPQLAGFQNGLEAFFKALKKKNIQTKDCHSFFNTTPEGKAIIGTLVYFAEILDDSLPTPVDIRHVKSADILAGIQQLTGKTPPLTHNPQLRLCRLVWEYVQNSPELHTHKAVTLLLFGANWMV